MNLELNVVRFENEDVIATSSCDKAWGVAMISNGSDCKYFNWFKNDADINKEDVEYGSDDDYKGELEFGVYHIDENHNIISPCPEFTGESEENLLECFEKHGIDLTDFYK